MNKLSAPADKDKDKDKEREDQFDEFINKFGKKYHKDSEEGKKRLQQFKKNLDLIDEENAKPEKTHKLGIGPWTDLSNEEYQSTILMNPEILKANIQTIHHDNSAFLQENSQEQEESTTQSQPVDWRGYLGAARNQGSCGSCWTFSTTAAMEGNTAILTGEKYYLAPQQLVDCVTSEWGCSGGWPERVLEDYVPSNGIMDDSNYSYTGSKGTCNYSTKFKRVAYASSIDYCNSIGGTPYYLPACNISRYLSILEQGPMSVLVDAASSNFQNYGSGVFYNTACGHQTNHAVTAVGWGYDSLYNAYYVIVRNSWGTGWGESGHIRVKFDPTNDSIDSCLVTQFAYRPNVTVPQGCVLLYKDCNYSGEKKLVCVNQGQASDFSQISGWNDNLSSIKLGKNTKVVVYEHAGCQGQAYPLSNDNSCMSDFNDKASSVAIISNEPPANCIWVFTDCCYMGDYREICGDVNDLRNIGMNDNISAMRLGSNVYSVYIYSDVYYSGNFNEYGNAECFKNHNDGMFNDVLSSLKLRFR